MNNEPTNKLTKRSFAIKGMHCSSCAMSIDMDLEDLAGIKKVQTSYAKAETEVEFDPSQVSAEQILDTIKKTGYSAQEI